MNLKYLNDRISSIGIPIKTIAERMGISRQALYHKINGEREFKTSEVYKLCDILRLTNEEKTIVFFADGVDDSDNHMTNTQGKES